MADFDSKYSGEQVEALLDQVASGNAGGGGGINEVYIADFTITSLREGIYDGIDVECDIQALVEAMNANKVILVREDEDSSFQGVHVLNGCAEDLLYFSIVDTAGNVLYCDGTDYVYTKSYINGQTLFYRNWVDKQDTLVSGENIKTINGESVVGSGNITIAGGSGEKGEKGDKGDTGVGVQSVKQTTTSNVDSGYNVVTVTLTDGTTSTFSVKNGSKGSSGTNGTNGKDGADGEDGATFTPSVDSAGNLSWTNNKGLTNPPTVNIKGPKGDAGEGGGSTGGGKEVILTEGMYFNDIKPVQPNKIYISNRAQTALYIGAFQEVSNYDEYCIIFKYPEDGCILPESVKFANGQIPTIEYGTECELNVVGIGSGANRTYHAVITPFKTL